MTNKTPTVEQMTAFITKMKEANGTFSHDTPTCPYCGFKPECSHGLPAGDYKLTCAGCYGRYGFEVSCKFRSYRLGDSDA